MGTGIDAGFAADAFGGINHAHIAVCCADMTSARWTVLHAHRLGTLPANEYLNILRIGIKHISGYLNPGPGSTGFSIMDKRAGQHATLASGALAAVINQVSF